MADAIGLCNKQHLMTIGLVASQVTMCHYHVILNLEEEAYKHYRLDLITRLDSVLTTATVNKAEV